MPKHELNLSVVLVAFRGVVALMAALPAGATMMRLGDPASLGLGHGGLWAEREKLVEIGATILLGTLACCAGAAAAALTVCCVYDTASYWYHQVHFHSCLRKVKRVHKVFSRFKGELPLCPYCVETITCQASPQKVVFLCGHRFHMDCANRWLLENPGKKAGRCPICCEGASAWAPVADKPRATTDGGAITDGPRAAAPAKLQESIRGSAEETDAPSIDSNEEAEDPSMDYSVSDEALAFILGSLHRRYPEIIPKSCVTRWFSCNTELWLTELACPRWQRSYPCWRGSAGTGRK